MGKRASKHRIDATGKDRKSGPLLRYILPPGRYSLPNEYCAYSMDLSSPVAFLLPKKDGPGICLLNLLFYLTTTHNEFMEAYLGATEKNARYCSCMSLLEET